MKKGIITVVLLKIILINIGITAYAGQWRLDYTGWWYDKGDGTWLVEQWQWLDGNGDGIAECYYFDQQGYCLMNGVTPDGYLVNKDGAWMINGEVQVKNIGDFENSGIWKLYSGRWYFEDIFGNRKTNGWYWLDGNQDGISECYYLDGEGWLLTNRITPDGYQVNADGAWVEGGVVKTKNTGRSHLSSTSSVKSIVRKKTSRENFWDDYEDYSVFYAVNDFIMGNYGQMTEEQIDEVHEQIIEFKENYIKSSMSDFEKEMQIIKWIIENCRYKSSNGNDAWNYGTAYSCIVNGEACCAGYADAFLQMATSCGLTARYIYNEDHAWNLIKLGGKWYHVDVTWEDQGDIWSERSLFVNLNDSIIKRISSHTNWLPSTESAKGIKYGTVAVDWYLQHGNDEFPNGKDLKRMKADPNDNVIQYSDKRQSIEQIEQYISRQIEQRKETYEYIIKTDFNYKDEDSLTNIYNLKMELEIQGYGNIYTKYSDVLEQLEERTTYKDLAPDNCYYLYKTGEISYKKEIDYVIRFVENGVEVGKENGSGVKNKYLSVECPEGYDYIYKENGTIDYTVHNGKGFFSGSSLVLDDGPVLEISINVQKLKKDYTYKVIYVDINGNVLYTSPVETAKQDSMVYFDKMEFNGYVLKSGQEFERKLITDDSIFYIYYKKTENKDEEESSKDNAIQKDTVQKREDVDQENKKQEEQEEHAEKETEKTEEETEQIEETKKPEKTEQIEKIEETKEESKEKIKEEKENKP